MKEYKIRVKNEIVTVSKEIYTDCYKMRRRERYMEEISIKNNLSYDQLVELDYSIEQKMCDPQLLVEDVIIEKIMLEKLMLAPTLQSRKNSIISKLKKSLKNKNLFRPPLHFFG